MCFSLSIKAQDAENKEKDAVKRVVETYLFSENDDERRQTLYEQAKIFSINLEKNQISEKPFTKAKKMSQGTKIIALQKVVGIDVFENAASVKVETDLSYDNIKIPKHYQFISLLKAGGEWKIVSILMPAIKPEQ